MWILNFLPSWIAYVIAGLGAAGLIIATLAGLFSRFFPQLVIIKFPLQVISVVVLVFGVYLSGGIANQEMWEARVKAMEEKVAIAEKKAREANARIEYKYVDRIKVVKEVQVVVQEKIKEVEKIIDAKCEVPNEAISILNMAAKMSLEDKKQQDENARKSLKTTKEKIQ